MPNKFLKNLVESTRKNAKIGDMPMAFIKTKDKKFIIAALALERFGIRSSMFALMKLHNAQEIVSVQEAYYVEAAKEDIGMAVSEHPEKKECFIVSYFSKDREEGAQLAFKRVKKKRKEILAWEGKPVYFDEGSNKNNPFTMTKEEVDEYFIEAKKESIRANGKKETIKLPMDFRIEIFRHEGKVFFDAKNREGKIFGTLIPQEEDEVFRKKMQACIKLLKFAGEKISEEDQR